jgi:hypothetical protein
VEKLDDFMSSPVIFLLLIDAPSDVWLSNCTLRWFKGLGREHENGSNRVENKINVVVEKRSRN